MTGKKKPLEKIVAEIKKMKNNISIDDFKKLPKPNKENRESLMQYLTGMAAMWSVGSNAKQHRLVKFYLEAMLVRKEIPDQFTNQVIAHKLNEIKVKTPAPDKTKPKTK